MEVPLLERPRDEDLDVFDWNVDETDLKLLSSGSSLQTLCSFLDSSSDRVSVEYDSEARSVKLLSESIDHTLEVIEN